MDEQMTDYCLLVLQQSSVMSVDFMPSFQLRQQLAFQELRKLWLRC